MKIHRNSNRRPQKTVLSIGALLLLVLAGWLLWAHHYQKWPFLPQVLQEKSTNVVNYEKPTTQQSQIGTSTKEKIAEEAKQQPDQPPAANIPISITSVQPGETIYVRTLINYVSSTATCNLSMVGPNGKIYTATTETQAMASTSTCKGFNVPMSSLVAGKWTITVIVTDGQQKGSTTTEQTL